MADHTLGWVDEGMAQIIQCGETKLPQPIILVDPTGAYANGTPESQILPCPVCGKRLRLQQVTTVEVVDG